MSPGSHIVLRGASHLALVPDGGRGEEGGGEKRLMCGQQRSEEEEEEEVAHRGEERRVRAGNQLLSRSVESSSHFGRGRGGVICPGCCQRRFDFLPCRGRGWDDDTFIPQKMLPPVSRPKCKVFFKGVCRQWIAVPRQEPVTP